MSMANGNPEECLSVAVNGPFGITTLTTWRQTAPTQLPRNEPSRDASSASNDPERPRRASEGESMSTCMCRTCDGIGLVERNWLVVPSYEACPVCGGSGCALTPSPYIEESHEKEA